MARKPSAAKKATAGKARSMKIKKGDHVLVIAGKDRGREKRYMRIISLAPEVL